MAPVKAKPRVSQWPETTRIAVGFAGSEAPIDRRYVAMPLQLPAGSSMKKQGPPPCGMKRVGWRIRVIIGK
jgi:hypothetical protein